MRFDPCPPSRKGSVPARSLPRAVQRPGWAGLLLLALGLSGLACGKSSSDPEVALTTINGVRCVDGTVACGDVCARLASSAEHCGACGVNCGAGGICDQGRCKPEAEGCSDRLLLCGSDCVDTRSDGQHCGECDQRCPSEGSCDEGSCECPGALTVCGESCADTSSDEQHCGACGNACVETQTCEAGSCACPSGTELCGSVTLALVDAMVTSSSGAAQCVDTASNPQHCGACGNACTGGQLCEGGSCVCPSGQTLCGDRCVDLQSDLQHCGACGTECGGGQLCGAGSCACPAGQTLCDGRCTDTTTDDAHCGACTTRCGLGQGCEAGSCQSGALGEDGCSGLAQNVSISQVAAYQTVKIPLAQNGQQVATPTPAVVAGRPTLFRAFVTPGAGWVERELSARLFLENGEELSTRYSESTLSLAAASTEDNRGSTFEFIVPAQLITDETRWAVELVECGEGAGAVQSPRFPTNDGADLAAVDAGGLEIRIIPLRSNGLLPDTSEAALALYRSAFLDTYPVSSVTFSVGQPVDIEDPEDWNNTLDTVRALRQQQAPAANVYYYGMVRPTETLRQFCGNGCTAGVGFVPGGRLNPATRAAVGLAYADNTSAFTMLHEVAHNHGRQHAPCVQGGTIAGVDPNYPQADGSTGVYGYDALGDNLLSPDDFTDLMGYCRNQWLSAYTYTGLLNTVLAVNRVQSSVLGSEPVGTWRVLLVDEERGARWGRAITTPDVAVGAEEPALVLDASGAAIQTISVFRTNLSELAASSIQVPEPQPDWASVQVSGAPPIAFRH